MKTAETFVSKIYEGLASSTRYPQQNIMGLGAVPHQEAQGVAGANNTFEVALYWKNFISRFFFDLYQDDVYQH